MISDSLGETAELVAKAAVSQFNSGQKEIRRVPYLSDEEQIEQVIEEVELCNAMIAYTLVLPHLKDLLVRRTREKNIVAVDVLGPMLEAVARATNLKPQLEPGLMHQLDDEYFRRVEAIEFAVKYDDGKDPRGILVADVVLIGISRTSKTPLCMYLANKRIKAANIPLVPEVAPPEELFEIGPHKIIGLTAHPEILNPIRQERLKSLGLAPNADYASMDRIYREIDYAEHIMKKLGCTVIDVSNKAIEETASKILQIYYRGDRFEKR